MDPFGGSQNDGFSQKLTFCASPKEPFPMAERKSETSFQEQLFKPCLDGGPNFLIGSILKKF
jgi:hypothetical protein